MFPANFLGRIFAIIVDVIITLIIWFVIVWLLGMIGIIIPAQIVKLLEILFVVFIIGRLFGFLPGYYSYPWLNRSI